MQAPPSDKTMLPEHPLTIPINTVENRFNLLYKSNLLLDTVPMIIIYADNDQRIQYVNKAFEEVFHHSPAQVIGQRVVDYLGQEAYDEVKEYRNSALAGQVSGFETEIKFKDGKDG